MAGGLLAGIAGAAEVSVNSLHGQGMRTLGRGLVVEATAGDGLVEAVRLDNRDRSHHGDRSEDPGPFLLAVQWHPEWKAKDNPHSIKLFSAFGDACRPYRRRAG